MAGSGGENERRWRRHVTSRLPLLLALVLISACNTVEQTDRDVNALIEARQRAALGYSVPIEVGADEPGSHEDAYARNPRPTKIDVPPEFEAPASQPTTGVSGASQPTTKRTTQPVATAPATQPMTRRPGLFTLTDALAYAQQRRREYQTAKENLYLAALSLTLERHLWTPIFSAQLKTVYGNYGEAQDFDQAMKFMAELGMSQKLPYGGEFTAHMISTLIRDVKKTITASEDSAVSLGLSIPLLRDAGHVAREGLIQLERELTYSVRTFERFRRRQLVTVAQSYFDLLRTKQRALDSRESLNRAVVDLERALEVEQLPHGDPLDTMRAEQRRLTAEAGVENAREAFRAEADRFKLRIGMPVDEPLRMQDLESITAIEQQIEAGEYPLLRRSPAVDDQELAIHVALERRFDLLTLEDRVDDARRGVTISRNALLPNLDWTGALTVDTDPDEYQLGGLQFDRANWKTELVLEVPLERTAERNQLRRSLIDVRQAQRAEQDLAEHVRAEVRSAVNQIGLAEISLRIQQRNVVVAELRAEYAKYRFEEIGDISNRDKVEAENELLNAQNALNQAKTTLWNTLLQFRLATETLRIDEEGLQREGREFSTSAPAAIGPPQ